MYNQNTMNELPASTSDIQTSLLSKINEWQVLRAIQHRGPMSRAEVARYARITAPTASKAAESLLKAGLLEEEESTEILRGRPARNPGTHGRAHSRRAAAVFRRRAHVHDPGPRGEPRDDRVIVGEAPVAVDLHEAG